MSYPLPRIDELAGIIPEGTKYFSFLDLKEAYYSLPINPNSRKYAAIIAHHGVFIPHRTSFKFKNTPMAFQQMMQSILAGCSEYTFVYFVNKNYCVLYYEKYKYSILIYNSILPNFKIYKNFLNSAHFNNFICTITQ